MIVMRFLVILVLFFLPFMSFSQEVYLNHHFELIDSNTEIESLLDDTKKKKYKLNSSKVIEYYKKGHLVAIRLDIDKVSPYQLRCLKNNDHLRKIASQKLTDLENRSYKGLSSDEVREKLGDPIESRMLIDGKDQLQLFYYPHGKVVTFREDILESVKLN